MAKKPSWYYQQASVVPFRMRDGEVEVLLITTRKRKNWILPKGIIEPGQTAEEAALAEAFEEAGVRGELLEPQVGSYTYQKWEGICMVQVFLMRVTEVADAWPEDEVRKRRWVSLDDARSEVHRLHLRQILQLTKDWFVRHDVDA